MSTTNKASVKQSTKFTDKFIQNLKPTPPKMYFIREGHGFTVRVLPSGLRTFFYTFVQNKKQQYFKIGHYPECSLKDARLKYQELYTKQSNGTLFVEPLIPEEKPPVDAEPVLFKDFAVKALEYSAKAHSVEYTKIITHALNADVMPAWGELPITSITRRNCTTLLERVAARAPGMTYNTLRAARLVLEYAVQREYLEYNPMINMSKVVPELKYTPRDRVLSEEEIKILWKNLEHDDSVTARAIKLVLVTAQRPGEVAGLHRNEIQGDTWPVWTIPYSRAQKGRGDHAVPLSPTAAALIGESNAENGRVFDIVRHAMSHRLVRHKYFGMKRFTPHDLRRTARTYMSKLGIPEEHSEAVLNHAKQGMQRVYNQYEYLEEKRVALLKWEAELLRIVNAE